MSMNCLYGTGRYCKDFASDFFYEAINPNNRVVKVLNDYKGQDKVFKFIEQGAFPLAIEIAAASGASERTMKNLNKGKKIAKYTRDFGALFNIIRGATIQRMIKEIGLIVSLVKDINNNVAVKLNPNKPEHRVNLKRVTINGVVHQNVNQLSWKARKTHNSVAYDRTEKLLRLGAYSFSTIVNLSYIGGFTLARPAANFRKWGKDIEFSPVGHQIADSFPYFMCTLHCASIVKNSFELAYEFKAYNRNYTRGDQNNYDQNDQSFWNQIIHLILNLIESVLEIINDILGFLRVTAPAYIRIPLSFSIATIGLYSIWRKTA